MAEIFFFFFFCDPMTVADDVAVVFCSQFTHTIYRQRHGYALKGGMAIELTTEIEQYLV